jgi:uncharacterized membrane protein YqjE
MSDVSGRPSTPSLIADAMAQMARLVETEVRLVRTELSEKISQALYALAIIAVSAVLLLAAIILLLIGVVHLLIYFGLQAFVSYFIVGVLAAVIGGIAVYVAISRLKPSGLAPNRSISQIGKDAQVIKEQVS